MFKIEGLDELSRQLKEAQEALANLGEELGTVSFNPHDPMSIEAAIQQIESTLDERLGEYASNPLIGPMADEMKESYRTAIIGQAAEARLKNVDDDA